MTTTLTIIDLKLDMTDDDLAAAGSSGQVLLKTSIADEDGAVTSENLEFFDTVEEANTVKISRESE
jgi:hypothetical protein